MFAAVRALLDRTSLRSARIVVASGATGTGLDEVRAALHELRDRVVRHASEATASGPRLAIDRVFAVRGRGTVVTGSLRGGPIAADARLRLVPGGPTVRIRGLQVHSRDVASSAGGRTAINLTGVDSTRIQRGAVLTADPAVVATDRILVALRPAAALDPGSATEALPADGARVLVHAGTARVEATVGRSGRESAALPGGELTAILRLAEPIAAAPGDALVVRRPSPGATLAGGRVLDADPPRGISRRRSTPDRLAALAAAPARSEAWLAARLDLHGAVATPSSHLAPDVAEWLADHIVGAVEQSPEPISRAALRSGAARELRRRITLDPAAAANFASAAIDQLAADGRLAADGDRLRDPNRADTGPSPELLAAMDRLEHALDTTAPPPLREAATRAGCPAAGIRDLVASRRIVVIDDDLAYATPAYRELERKALALAGTSPLTPAALRDATGTSRKYVMAILEDLGRRGVLKRTPDGHVPGPRAAIELSS